ncbi:hypothetical protein FA09DRAFT_360321 [Tilletiopsis washingtonensis]|uniref:N-alpha-acetyltransferase 40 n=1 Tax=Tilletiopsis washingtonensis TaxID=58919 RepID=A0A316ZEE0_9BASI|nr:hypothetical protein FA09DRAFT_360321 [Tilletiopsis washingtonensis]PWN98613.1 hypothetical protein FA09DRAFT_360321 [Tilletiopsis washingtonensis]
MHKRRAARPAAARPSGAKAAVAQASQLTSRALCALLRTADSSLLEDDGGDGRSLLLPELRLSIARPSELSFEEQDALFALLETNMRALYETSKSGWDAAEKRGEMYDPASRFLLLRPRDAGVASTLGGFLLFRFDTERCAIADPDGRAGGLVEVGYCYELQVDAASRGAGLGKVLMRHFEALALHAGMRKTMLTVFTSNECARRFYRHIGYGEDAITPARTLGPGESLSDYDYEILSRPLDWRGSR